MFGIPGENLGKRINGKQMYGTLTNATLGRLPSQEILPYEIGGEKTTTRITPTPVNFQPEQFLPGHLEL